MDKVICESIGTNKVMKCKCGGIIVKTINTVRKEVFVNSERRWAILSCEVNVDKRCDSCKKKIY